MRSIEMVGPEPVIVGEADDVSESRLIRSTIGYIVQKFHQPRGGFIPVKDALVVDFDGDETDLKPGNLSPQAVNKVVNYFSRFMLFGEVDDVFDLPLRGAKLLGGNQCAYAYGLSKVMSGLDNDSIDAACKLAAFDVAYCQSPAYWAKQCSESDIKASENDIYNIRLLISRFLEFAEKYPLWDGGTNWAGRCFSEMKAGDFDLFGFDTLWDMKCTTSKINSKTSLRLAAYNLEGKRSYPEFYKDLTHIGVFNPCLNKCWIWDMASISEDTEKAILWDVLGYAG